MSRHYLDHASTSPLRAEALAAMVEWWESGGGDPGRIHQEGMTARVAVEEARERVAAALGARPREVVFTSGATESIAAACFGAARSRGPHSVLAGVEHSAVREWAARADHTVVPVDSLGRIDVDAMGDVVGDDTGVVHCQWGNHEVATLQPVEAVVGAVDGKAPVHSDAAAAVGHVPVAFDASGVDLMSVSSHKFGGPTGAGALLVRRGLRVDPLLVGGDQERARRAGMEDVAAVVGFAAGLEAAVAAMDEESVHSRHLTDRVIEWADTFDGVAVVGDTVGRLPHLVCLTIEGIEPQPVLLGLDQAGVAVHSGSSCSSESIEPSPVLEAMGVDAQRSLRVSVGWSSSDEDIDRLLAVLPGIIGDLRSLRG